LGRILALDLGTRRIGLAVSDELAITAQGMPTLTRRNLRTDLEELAHIAAEKNVDRILLGDPKRMSGDAGRQSDWVREFAARMEKRLGLPVEFWDERLTSREAERTLRGSGIAHGDRKAAIDRLSAVILLQSYLDARAYRADEAAAEPQS
jgi:putative Holliday junction resolvase